MTTPKNLKGVILDSYAFNPGDLDLSSLEKQLDELKVYPRVSSNPDEIIKAIGDASILFTNKTPLSEKILKACPNVRYIGVLATGMDVVDAQYCKKNGITVKNAKNYSTLSVAQHTFSMLFHHLSKVGSYDKSVKEGDWQSSDDFCFYLQDMPVQISQKSVGILGFGDIGKKIAQIFDLFGCNVLVHTRTIPENYKSLPYRFVEFQELVKESDILSIHCPLTQSTKNLFNIEVFSKMKPSSILINTARGGLIDHNDLLKALDSGLISHAILDVFETEPPLENKTALTSHPKTTITPHIAWAGFNARKALLEITLKNLKDFLNKTP